MSPFLISDAHVAQFAERTPPWGFNGLGYVTYKRTYARPIFVEGSDVIERTEEWYETVQRVVNGAQNIGAELSEDEAKRLYEYLFNLKGSVAGRMLWQLGTANNERLGGDSLVNCLGGETEVVTLEGIRRIDELAAAGSATVMTDFGKWVTADVLNFGDQPLAEIVLRRGHHVKTVRATAEHRWFVVGVDGREEYFTRELAHGMRLVSVHPEETEDEESFVHWEVVSVKDYGDPEPVYCAVVPETHSFVLANNILTGNCWFVDIEKPTDFSWAVERLMLGGGVGFSCDKPERLGVARAATVSHRDANDSDFIVPDTREGWGNLIRKVFECYLGDDDYPSVMTYATHLVRPAGVPIRTFGGSASGPEILIHGVEKICSVLDGAVGRHMTSVEVLDCMNIIGSIVVAGNVRRSAEIAVGSLDDEAYLMAKRWDLGDIPIERAMSNNTVFVSAEQMKNMPDLIWEGYKGNGEPYGFFNLEASRKFGRTSEERPDNSIVGLNPCSAGDSLILTSKGLVEIGSLVGQEFEVWNGHEFTRSTVWKTGVRPVYEVELTNGLKTKVTDNHLLAALTEGDERGRGSVEVEIMARDIEGMKVMPLLGPGEWSGIEIPFDDAVLCGLLLGDGWNKGEGTPAAYMYNSEPEVIEFLEGCGFRLHQTSTLRGAPCQTLSGANKLVESYGFDITPNLPDRAFPSEFMQMSADTQRAVLRGLFSANGAAQPKYSRISLKTTCIELAQQVQKSLLALGFPAYITTNEETDIEWPNGTFTSRESYDVNLASAWAYNKFQDEIGFLHAHKSERVTDRPVKRRASRVKSVTYVGVMDVYDFCEPETNWGWIDGFKSHNCAEIPLANRESCNLSEIFLPMIDSPEELEDVAILLYKVQKAVAALPYLDPASDEITSKNMRLGLGVTGVAQAMDKIDWLDAAYVGLRKFDSEWSAKRGWPESVRMTTIKPSGTLSLLPGVTPGVHPGFSQYFVKRMRMSSSDILVNYCRSKGFHVEPLRNFDGSEDSRTVVVEFPCAFPDGTILAEHMSAIEQMDLVRRLQRVWADNSISVTVYYRKDELEDIKSYLVEHWGEMKSVSFLLHSEHGFDQAPMGEMGAEEYAEMIRNSSPLGEKLSGSTILSEDEMALYGEGCDTNACPMR